VDTIYAHHRLTAGPLGWAALGRFVAARGTDLAAAGGAVFGAWRAQIGRPRDEVAVITAWTRPIDAAEAQARLLLGAPSLASAATEIMRPTLRPRDATPPTRQGNYAFRWSVAPASDWPEFLRLCAEAWPGFEASYDSQIIGLWLCTGDRVGPVIDEPGPARSLLMTRRPDLAMWERSKLPQDEAEAKIRATLSRRYDLCSWTLVYTTTLLTAADREDVARWT
jgi:hypothetical protein